MAVYEFECQACGERFEVTRGSVSATASKTVPRPPPECGNRKTQQLVSAFNCKAPSKY